MKKKVVSQSGNREWQTYIDWVSWVDGGLCIDTDSFLVLIKGNVDAGLSEGSRMIAKSTRSIDTWLWRRTTKARCDQATAICSENETTAEAIHAVVAWKEREEKKVSITNEIAELIAWLARN